jgi:hypothetical protein
MQPIMLRVRTLRNSACGRDEVDEVRSRSGWQETSAQDPGPIRAVFHSTVSSSSSQLLISESIEEGTAPSFVDEEGATLTLIVCELSGEMRQAASARCASANDAPITCVTSL